MTKRINTLTKRIAKLTKQIANGLRWRKKRHRQLATHKSQIADRRHYRDRQQRKRNELIQEIEKRGPEDPEQPELQQRLLRVEYEIAAINRQLRELQSLRKRAADAIRKINGRLERRKQRRAEAKKQRKRLRRRRRERREKRIVATPGDPHWGGSEDILRNEADPVAARMGHARTSGKREETYGNPGSDHHTSQTTASARDYQPGVQLAIEIAKVHGVPYYGYGQDYQLHYIRRDGRTYRVQIIAANHGTGPHVHDGVRLVG